VGLAFSSSPVGSTAGLSRLVSFSLLHGRGIRETSNRSGERNNFQFQLQVGAVLGKDICVESSDEIAEKQIRSLRQLLG
jgi:hypothetical protein